MPAVHSGDASTVDAVINQYSQIDPLPGSGDLTSTGGDHEHTGSPTAVTAGRRDRNTEQGDVALPPTKRMRTSTSGPGLNREMNMADGQSDSEMADICPCQSSNHSIEIRKFAEETNSHDGVSDGQSDRQRGVFYELSVKNSNILHVCGQLLDIAEEKAESE